MLGIYADVIRTATLTDRSDCTALTDAEIRRDQRNTRWNAPSWWIKPRKCINPLDF